MSFDILIVEDNPSMQLNLELFLSAHNFNPIVANNGQEGLEKLSIMKSLPQIIISDIEMPIMNGYEFYVIVSENPNWSQIPFIFLSARSDPKDIKYSIELGVDEYFVKPFEEDMLLKAITNRINGYNEQNVMQDNLFQNLNKKKFENLVSIPDTSQISTNLDSIFYTVWDEQVGPVVKQEITKNPSNLDDRRIIRNNTLTSIPEDISDFDSSLLAVNLFMVFENIYGEQDFKTAQSVVLPIMNLKRECLAYFHSYCDTSVRCGLSPFMFCVIAKKFDYITTQRIKKTLDEIGIKIRANEPWDINNVYEKLKDFLDLKRKIVKEVWIFNSEGTNLFTHAPNSEVDPDLLCNFITALQGFSLEVGKRQLNALELGSERYSIFHHQQGKFYCLGRVNKFIPEENTEKILSEISTLFYQKFKSYLGSSVVKVTQFESFDKNILQWIVH